MKKMALVPHSMVAQMMEAQRDQQQLVTDSPLIQLSSLDQQLKEVLESAEPSDIKAKKYGQILQTYSSIRNKEVYRPVPSALSVPATHNWLNGLAASYINKGRILKDHVEKNPDLQWNDKNEIFYKGNRIAGSNVVDLIHTFVKKSNNQPTGWQEFGKALLDNNVPRTAIANENLLNRVRPLFDENLQTQPLFASNDDRQLVASLPGPSNPAATSPPIRKRLRKPRPTTPKERWINTYK